MFDVSALEPRYLIKPVSAFKHENILYIQTFLTIVIVLFSYYQCRKNSNLSYVDHYRGIIPIIYSITANIHYYYHNKSCNTRLLLVGLFTITWGIRMVYYINIKLTKRGKFQQDLRWDVVYTFINQPQRPYIWKLFVFFVANLYQILSWFIMINMPLFMIYTNSSSLHLLYIDYILSVLYLLFFIFECIADYQMIQFRKIKFKKMFLGHSIMYTKKDIIVEGRGGNGDEFAFNGWRYDFLSTGLRKYCCHPNYFAEMGLWAVVYLFGIVSYKNNGDIISIMGLIGYLSLCFKLYKLAIITEGILAYSYGSYYRFRGMRNRFIPWIPKGTVFDESVLDDNRNKIEEQQLSEKCSKWSGDNIWIG